MDFSLTSFFVVPVGNSLPTTGSTETLTAGQFGIYKDKLRTAATAANVGTATYIQIAQGRPGTGLGTKLSDRIKSTKLKKFYKIVGHSTAANEIWELSGLTAKVGEDVVVSWRVHSALIEARHPNGLTQSVTIPADCVTCGADPCTEIANETLIDAFFAQYNLQLAQQASAGNAVKLDSFLTFEKIGTGDDAVIRITGKPVESVPVYSPDIATRNVDKDRLWFRPFVYIMPETSADFYNPNDCNAAGTAILLQRSSFVTGSSEEVKQMEVDFYSYQATVKPLFRAGQFNQQFVSYVTDGTTYDLYFILFDELNPDSDAWAATQKIDEQVIIAVPSGATSTIEAILEAYLGAAEEPFGTEVTTTTTTTTTTTSSTTSTSTTLSIP
jgi:hypothetical protein